MLGPVEYEIFCSLDDGYLASVAHPLLRFTGVLLEC